MAAEIDNTPVPTVAPTEGAFVDSLKRNNKQIRQDRAAQIGEDAQLIFKRTVEDIRMDIRKLAREREAMLDLSPTSADSLILASDFNATNYVQKDLELGVKIRNLEIKLDIAEKRYKYLFGNTLN